MQKVNRQDDRKKNRLLYRPINGLTPYDKMFVNKYGQQELCHSTGMEIYDHLGDEWWNEYVDSYGDFHYGRYNLRILVYRQHRQTNKSDNDYQY